VSDNAVFVTVEWDIEDGYDPADFTRGTPSSIDLGLPGTVEIPTAVFEEYKNEIDLGFNGEVVISDYLSDTYGFTHFGWEWVKET